MEYDCLIVDDEVELDLATCEYFEMFGVSAKHVVGAGECLTFLENNRVKLLLLDINLEGENGLEN